MIGVSVDGLGLEKQGSVYNFHPVDRTQQFLLPQNMMDWLPLDHFARFVVELVEALDTGSFLAAYRADGRGRDGVSPDDDDDPVGVCVL